jgi:eukaryotic-like serine/threonine-protein kinase
MLAAWWGQKGTPMSEADGHTGGRRRNSLDHRIDVACDQFEAAWRAGHEPRIEDYLTEAREPDRNDLLRELMALEWELRGRRGERRTVDEYFERFPEQAALVRIAFGAEPGAGSEPTTGRSDDTGRNLLFGVLALQNNFIGREDLLAAFAAWVADRTRSLGQLLVDRGALDDVRRGLLQALVAEHLKQHGGNIDMSLVAVSSLGSVREELERLNDVDLRTSLAGISGLDRDSGATAAYSSSSRGAGERFRILRFHRDGGLGRVYIARDEELGREVALKEIRPDKVAEANLRRRFVLEAEINGGLEHPGIVPVYSLGSHGDGRPFYAMRFVEGDSLKEAIESYHKASPQPQPTAVEFRKLLGRFIDVCEAIAFAHSKGVLHRDLKPHNVMLGRFGETLLIDWGLAKATGHREPVGANVAREETLVPPSGSDLALTLGVIGSPPYMSPEQAAGHVESLGPATDVYGLGAILYSLLTGVPPVSGATTEDVLGRARRGAVAPPRELNPRVPTALEAVCLKALALRPEDRHSSARDLADDVERWLADEPVSALREPLSERARRWMRRRRTAVTATVAALLVALVGLVALLTLQSKANRDLRVANDRERARFDLALSAIRTFYTGVSEDFMLKQETFKDLRTKLLRGANEFYQKLEDELKGQTDERSRSALGEAYFELARLTSTIGSKEEALKSYETALAIRQKLADDKPFVNEFQRMLAGSLINIGILQKETGRTKDAIRSYEKARAIFMRLAEANPTVTQLQSDLAGVHTNIGNLQRETGQTVEALRSYETGRVIFQKLATANPTITQFQSNLAWSHLSIGSAQSKSGKIVEALRSYETAREILQKLDDANPTVNQFRADLAQSHHNIGFLKGRMGQTGESLQSYEKARAIRQKLADANPAVTVYQRDLMASHNDIGVLQIETGRTSEALYSFEQARAMRQKLADANPTVTQFQTDLAKSHNNIGALLRETGRTNEALYSFEQARAIRQKLADAEPNRPALQTDLAGIHNNIGALHAETGKPTAALQAFGNALAIRQKLADANPTGPETEYELALSHYNIGHLHADTGKTREALLSYEKARAIEKKLVDSHPTDSRYQSALGSTSNAIAWSEIGLKEWDKAHDRLLEAIQHCRLALRGNPKNLLYRKGLAIALANMVQTSLALRMPADAADAAREMVSLNARDQVTLYNGACFLARCVPLATEQSDAFQYADDAAAILNQAVAAGWGNAAHIANDPDLVPLHDRADFRRLVAILFDRVFPALPFAQED